MSDDSNTQDFSAISFGFDNPQIKAYFEGSDEYIPSSETVYIHEHPLVTPNFLSELEVFINIAALQVSNSEAEVDASLLTAINSSLEKIAPNVDSVTTETAPALLEGLRSIYKLCKTITGLQLPLVG